MWTRETLLEITVLGALGVSPKEVPAKVGLNEEYEDEFLYDFDRKGKTYRAYMHGEALRKEKYQIPVRYTYDSLLTEIAHKQHLDTTNKINELF